ncbi:MAG: AAA family ATPase [Verrucomicrobia bacterium]|nr:AAA family ATPase [Verrucomicrobiota bacterium]
MPQSPLGTKVWIPPPRIESLRVRNFRALRDVHLKKIQPFTVLTGPNGSGKSTLLDALAFLAESFEGGLRKAWDRRGRFKELRTRDSIGPVTFDVQFRERRGRPLITYHLEVNEDESTSGPVVAREWMDWKDGPAGRPTRFLDFGRRRPGFGRVRSILKRGGQRYKMPSSEEEMESHEVLAADAYGQFTGFPEVAALRRFITGWHLPHLDTNRLRSIADSSPQEHLSASGDNLANVIQYLTERHEPVLRTILKRLVEGVPRLEGVATDAFPDGRLSLQFKDAPFSRPIDARFASDGTLRMLAYLCLLHDPAPPKLIGLEEPENQLHPRLLPLLAEECRDRSSVSQLLVTTHSPYFVNALRSEEVWVLFRDAKGYSKTRRVCDIPRIRELMEHGALLGQLWMEGQFDVGDPLTGDGDVIHNGVQPNDGDGDAP